MSYHTSNYNTNKRTKLTPTQKTTNSTDIQFLSEILSWSLNGLQEQKTQYDTVVTELIKQHETHKPTEQKLCNDFDSVRQYQQFYTQLHYNNVLAELLQKYNNNNFSCTEILYTLSSINVHSAYEYMYYIELFAQTNQSINIQRGDILLLQSYNDQSISRLIYVDSFYVKSNESIYIKGMITLSYDIQSDCDTLATLQRSINTYFTATNIDMNVVSYLREFNAIQSINDIKINRLLIQPTRSNSKQQSTDTKQHIEQFWAHTLQRTYRNYMNYTLNQSQLIAVQTATYNALKSHTDMNALSNYITLLTGPPGTGKSKTATAVLNTLHVCKYSQHYESIIDMLLHSMHSQAAAHLKHKLQTQQAQQAAKAYNVIDLTTQHYTKPINNSTQPIVLSGSNNDLSSILLSMPKPKLMSRPDSPLSHTSSNSSADSQYQPKVLPKPRFLVCAPSNAAVDELISRVLNSFKDATLQSYKPDIVRVGVSDSMRTDIKQVISLDAIVDNYLSIDMQKLQHKVRTAKIEIQKIDKEMFDAHMHYYKLLQAFEHKLQKSGDTSTLIRPRHLTGGQFIANIVSLHEKRYRMHIDVQRWQIALEYNQAKLSLQNVNTTVKVIDTPQMLQLRDQMRVSTLNTTHIVFCTLSGSGLELLSQVDRSFDVLLVDEAAQAIESSTLIAMKHNALHTILIGDTNQLPATTFDKLSIAKQYYERSLFERLQHATHSTLALNIQFRMHPEIAVFPSKHFYSDIGGLLNGDNVYSDKYKQLYHGDNNYLPFLYWNVECNAIQKNSSGSLYNHEEALFIVKLLINLLSNVDSTINAYNIVVITFYAYHRYKLRTLIDAMCSSANGIPMSDIERQAIFKLQSIDICTVDSYQGRENDIVVISCVRNGSENKIHNHHSIGFVSDIRRINVSLTRAKHACWVVGDSRALTNDSNWNELIVNAKQRGLYREASKLIQTNNTVTKSDSLTDIVYARKPKHSNNAAPKQNHTEFSQASKSTKSQNNEWITIDL